jgi:hypothetical protein
LEGTREHRAVEGAMSHGLLTALAQLVRIHIGLFMGRKIDRLRLRKTVFSREGGEPLARPVRQRFFEYVQSPELDEGAVDKILCKIIDGARSGEVRIF